MSDFDAASAADQLTEGIEDGGKQGRESASTTLVKMAQQLYAFGVSDLGETYALPREGPKVVSLLRGSRTSLRALLARRYFEALGKTAPQQALADALNVIEGYAQEEDPVRLHLRVARHGGALWLDMGGQDGRVIKVTRSGWAIEDEAPVLFKRTSLSAPLPEPDRGGELGDLWAWLNVSEEDRPLVAAWLVAALFEGIPHPVLTITGEQGTGKTTAARVLASILDPSPVQVRKPPRDPESWVTAASGSWVVGLDNLSSVPLWLSDSLCRAVTGDGDVRRKLFTDGDLAVFAYRRCIIINGIDLGGLNPDLADRLVTVMLDLIPASERLEEEEFAGRWRAAHPKVLGAVLTLASEVMEVYPSVQLRSKPRMADFARVLAAVDAIMLTDGLTTYAKRAAGLSAVSLSADLFAARLVDGLLEEFEGTAAQLLAKVTPDDPGWRPPKDWPATAQVVTGKVRRFAPALRKLGWVVDDLGDNNHDGVTRWRLIPPSQCREDGILPPRPPQSPRKSGQNGQRGERAESGEVFGPSLHGERGNGNHGATQRDHLVPLPSVCATPGDDHEGSVRLYASGRFCDRHAPGKTGARQWPAVDGWWAAFR